MVNKYLIEVTISVKEACEKELTQKECRQFWEIGEIKTHFFIARSN